MDATANLPRQVGQRYGIQSWEAGSHSPSFPLGAFRVNRYRAVFRNGGPPHWRIPVFRPAEVARN